MSASGTTLPFRPHEGAALLLNALREPREPRPLDGRRAALLLSAARAAGLLPRLAAVCDAAGEVPALPAGLRAHLDTARSVAAQRDRQLRCDVHLLKRALQGLDLELVLLKGAAYAFMDLSFARGRPHTDLDILVPRERIEAVRRHLEARGWASANLPPHQQWYFRHWMHELPIMTHAERGTMLDLHHALLPRIDPLHFEGREVLGRVRPSTADPSIKVPAPEDLLLHAALNLLRHGDYRQGLRDLCDIAAMLSAWQEDADFRRRLLERIETLSLQRPVFYAWRYARLLAGATLAGELAAAMRSWQPPRAALRVMDRLVPAAVLPPRADGHNRGHAAAQKLLGRYPLCLWRKSLLPKFQRLVQRPSLNRQPGPVP